MPESKTDSRVHCNAALMLSQGDKRHPAGTKLCPEDKVEPRENQESIVLCTLSHKYVSSALGTVSSLCNDQNIKILRRPNKDGTFGGVFRGNSANSRVQRPFGNVLIEPSPPLQWKAVKGATEYQVQVEGFNLKWNRFIKGKTHLLYPESAPPLNPGQVYKITITAYSPESAIQHVRSSYQILSNETAAEIQKAEQLITDLRLPISQEAKSFDSLYIGFKLLNRSIERLETAVDNGADQSVRQLLAKRYSEAGNPELAEKLAISNYENHSQLPDRIKPLQ